MLISAETRRDHPVWLVADVQHLYDKECKSERTLTYRKLKVTAEQGSLCFRGFGMEVWKIAEERMERMTSSTLLVIKQGPKPKGRLELWAAVFSKRTWPLPWDRLQSPPPFPTKSIGCRYRFISYTLLSTTRWYQGLLPASAWFSRTGGWITPAPLACMCLPRASSLYHFGC